MKIIVNMDYEKMDIDLEYSDYFYSERWYIAEDKTYRTKGESILSQIQCDGSEEDFGGDLLDAIEDMNFCDIWGSYLYS